MDDLYLTLIISGIVVLAFMVGQVRKDKTFAEGYCMGYNDALKDLKEIGELQGDIEIIVKK